MRNVIQHPNDNKIGYVQSEVEVLDIREGRGDLPHACVRDLVAVVQVQLGEIQRALVRGEHSSEQLDDHRVDGVVAEGQRYRRRGLEQTRETNDLLVSLEPKARPELLHVQEARAGEGEVYRAVEVRRDGLELDEFLQREEGEDARSHRVDVFVPVIKGRQDNVGHCAAVEKIH